MNTKYVLGLSWPTKISLEHKEKKPKDYDQRQPAAPPWFYLSLLKYGTTQCLFKHWLKHIASWLVLSEKYSTREKPEVNIIAIASMQ